MADKDNTASGSNQGGVAGSKIALNSTDGETTDGGASKFLTLCQMSLVSSLAKKGHYQ